jgi:hypothetical protein
MIHLPVHVGHHHGSQSTAPLPVRPIAAITAGVLLVNIALLCIAFGLRGGPPSDTAQIEELVHHQITALNDRDPAALQLTYCAESGPIGGLIIDTLGPADADSTVDVARITDIRFIGSSPADLATASVTLTVSGTGNEALSTPPQSVSYFKREETGWKMCQQNDLQQVTRHL